MNLAFRSLLLFALLLNSAQAASASVCESFLSGLAHSIHTSQAWKSCTPVCDIDLSRVGDHFPELVPSAHVTHPHTFYNGSDWPPSENYPDAETYTFLIPLSPEETHKIEITIQNLDSQKTSDTNRHYAISIVKLLPFKTIKATRRIEVINRNLEENLHARGFSFQSGRGSTDGVIYTVNSGKFLSPQLIKHFLHEHGHNIAGYIYSTGFYGKTFPSFWAKIVKSEHGTVSDYAKHNLAEDFAETLRVYLTTTGEEHAQFRKQFPRRAKALDLIFSEHFGGFKNGSDWDKLKYYNTYRIQVRLSSLLIIFSLSLERLVYLVGP